LLLQRRHAVGECKFKDKQFNFGLLDIFWESITGALGIDAGFVAQRVFRYMIETIEYARVNFFPHISHGDIWALIAKIGASFISRPAGIEGSVVREDFEGDHLQFMKNTNEDMKDFIVEGFSEPLSEVGKGSLTRQTRHGKAGIGTISPAFVLVPEMFAKLGDSGISIEISEQVNQEETWRIVAGRSKLRIAVGCEGTDKTEINKGCDHPWHAALDRAIGSDLHKFFLEPILR
jgi:hypothetical protein